MVIRGLKIPLRGFKDILYFYLQNTTEYILHKFYFYLVRFLLLVALTFASYLFFNLALHGFSYLFHFRQVYFLPLVSRWGIETQSRFIDSRVDVNHF